MDAPVDTQNIEACHRLKSGNNDGNKIIAKFNKRKDMVRVMSKKNFLKNANFRWCRSPSTFLFINPSLWSMV